MNTENKQQELPLGEAEQRGAVSTNDPAENYNPSTRIPKRREFVLERPGNINFALPGGSYPGSRLVVFTDYDVLGLELEDYNKMREQVQTEFGGTLGNSTLDCTPADLLNLYFKNRANLLTVMVAPNFDGSLTVVFTNHLEGKKLEQFQRYQHVVAEQMKKAEEEDEAREAKANEAAIAEAERQKKLVALGEKVEKLDLINKLRKLDDEMTELRVAHNKLKKKAKAAGVKVED